MISELHARFFDSNRHFDWDEIDRNLARVRAGIPGKAISQDVMTENMILPVAPTGPMTNFSPFPTFRFRLSDFPTFSDLSPALPTVYNCIIMPLPPSPTSSDEVRRGPWPCSATFGAVDRDHECHLHEAKSALTFLLS